MKDKQKKINSVIVVALIVLAGILVAEQYGYNILGSILPGGADYQLPGGEDDPFDMQDQSPPPDSPPPPPPTNPFITLTVNPKTVNREDSTLMTIDSNLNGYSCEVMVRHEIHTSWLSLGWITLDATGSHSQYTLCSQAGWWQVRAQSGTVISNVEDLTVLGITIYQQKSTYHVGEVYSGSATSTYRNWLVVIFVKNTTDVLWDFYAAVYTDAHGVIPYGTLSETLTGVGTGSLDIIAIIDRESADFYYAGAWLDEHQYSGYDDDVSAIPSHIVDKSNILTFQVLP